MSLPDQVLSALASTERPVCAYIYDTGVARDRVAAVRAALPPGATLYYAVKANGHPALVGAYADTADGLEVASGGELALALDAGARRIAFGGPAKTPAELSAAHEAARTTDLTLHVESALELRRLGALGPLPSSARVALRVNRAVAGPAGSHAMTGTPTPFGIDETQLASVASLAASLGVPVCGFHLHAVSNSLDAPAYAAFAADAVAWSRRTAAELGIDLRYVNVGGGFGISYDDPGRSFDLTALDWSALDLPDGVELAFEPGRFLAAPAGWYAAEVLDLKRTHGRWFAVLRGGTHHFRLPAAWGYSHPFTVVRVDDWPHPWERPEISGVEVDVVGELCTPRDVLARRTPIDRLRVGDLLVFGQTGAYGWDISHHEFLRHPHPDVIVL
ncbi:diaminopimelate decarboxylase [Hamadaea flava]|uniref:Type III PLP-dependent enzyme n=1 Tax=Hamadaea flava TaxID=1742688 RepID=A0ABV8LV42_9ACTN|nr:type III PLP-dependent enzyme [Hamadaea flava]MCP2321839.1 diaminopimelate decarboxylase [Hamadaea flava]